MMKHGEDHRLAWNLASAKGGHVNMDSPLFSVTVLPGPHCHLQSEQLLSSMVMRQGGTESPRVLQHVDVFQSRSGGASIFTA